MKSAVAVLYDQKLRRSYTGGASLSNYGPDSDRPMERRY
jgi:hypothetical protein